MLSEWLAPGTVPDFVTTCLRRRPSAGAGTAGQAVPMFGWGTLDAVLRRAPDGDILVVRNGEEVAVPVPRCAEQLRALMADRIGVVIRRGERHHEDLRAVAASFARDLPGTVHVQLFVTPAGTHGFGWHYDLEDVFIAQTAGVKDYYFRENTVAWEAPSTGRLDFSPVRRETSPLMTARLVAGDWLYLPSRWWHMAKCIEDALSISVGVMPPT
jgi:50S ribosomal protein L16 3-hydroxylase